MTEHRLFTPSDYIESGQDGWLLPGGSFYPCATDEHDACAAAVVQQNPDKHPDMSALRIRYGEFGARAIAQEVGAVLVRGQIVLQPSFGLDTTFSAAQLAQLNAAKVRILDCLSGETHSPEVAYSTMETLRGRIDTIKQTAGYQAVLSDAMQPYNVTALVPGDKQATYTPGALFGQNIKIARNGDTYGSPAVIETLEHFRQSPLSAELYLGNETAGPGEQQSFSSLTYDALTEGSLEGVRFDFNQGRNGYECRVLPTETPGLYAVVQKSTYRHDGKSAGLTVDFAPVTARVSLTTGSDLVQQLRKYMGLGLDDDHTLPANFALSGTPNLLRPLAELSES